MSSDNSTIIHLGYPKAASSFLKREYFASRSRNIVVPRNRLLRTIRETQGTAEQISTEINNETEFQGDRLIISSENLSGESFWKTDKFQQTRRNLALAFPDSKIVIVIREQNSYIKSAFAYSVYTGHHLPAIEQFFDQHQHEIVEKLCFDRLISEYQETFGKERVLVLPVEQLKSNPDTFYKTLDAFTGLSQQHPPMQTVENKSPENWGYIELLRRANFSLKYIASAERYLRRLTDNNLVEGTAHKVTLYRALTAPLEPLAKTIDFDHNLLNERAKRVLSESNRATSSIIGSDLKNFGYM